MVHEIVGHINGHYGMLSHVLHGFVVKSRFALQKLRSMVHETVGRINGHYGHLTMCPSTAQIASSPFLCYRHYTQQQNLSCRNCAAWCMRLWVASMDTTAR